jgi:LmbE family N-acetylglucosaminyl deacetylase
VATARLAVISPHLDDAVFGCSALMARHPGAVAIGLFAGVPARGRPAGEWDTACGFASAREAIVERRREDRQALAHLGARPYWIEVLDAQYRDGERASGIERRLALALEQLDVDLVAFPAGLFHEDHHIAHDIAMARLRARDGRGWIVYEDALYRGLDAQTKRRAVHCYASQLRGFTRGGQQPHADLYEPEGYWTLEG